MAYSIRMTSATTGVLMDGVVDVADITFHSWDDGTAEGEAAKKRFTESINYAFRERFANFDFEAAFRSDESQ